MLGSFRSLESCVLLTLEVARMEGRKCTLQCTLEAGISISTQHTFDLHRTQEAALISQQVSSLALRPKPPEWLAVKTGESLAARRRTSGSAAAQQNDEATLVRCLHAAGNTC